MKRRGGGEGEKVRRKEGVEEEKRLTFHVGLAADDGLQLGEVFEPGSEAAVDDADRVWVERVRAARVERRVTRVA